MTQHFLDQHPGVMADARAIGRAQREQLREEKRRRDAGETGAVDTARLEPELRELAKRHEELLREWTAGASDIERLLAQMPKPSRNDAASNQIYEIWRKQRLICDEVVKLDDLTRKNIAQHNEHISSLQKKIPLIDISLASSTVRLVERINAVRREILKQLNELEQRILPFSSKKFSAEKIELAQQLLTKV